MWLSYWPSWLSPGRFNLMHSHSLTLCPTWLHDTNLQHMLRPHKFVLFAFSLSPYRLLWTSIGWRVYWRHISMVSPQLWHQRCSNYLFASVCTKELSLHLEHCCKAICWKICHDIDMLPIKHWQLKCMSYDIQWLQHSAHDRVPHIQP